MSDKSLSKKLPLLGGLLAVQVVIAGLLFWQGNSQDTVQIESLLAVEAGEIDRVEMVSEDNSMSLRREGGRWMLPEGLPVDEEKLTGLLNDISELRAGWPVATTEGAHERFKVDSDNFRYRIKLFSKDQEAASLIVGTAPGFRQVHVRKPGERDVYSVDLNAYVMEPEADQWLDTTLLQPGGDIERIAVGDFVIEKQDGEWPTLEKAAISAEDGLAQVEDDATESGDGSQAASSGDADAEPGADAVATDSARQGKRPPFDAQGFSQALDELRVLGLADKPAELDAPDTKSDADEEGKQLVRFKVSVSSSEGDYTYELLSRDNNYYIRRGDFDATFRVSKPLYDRFDALRQHASQANS